MIKWLKNKYGKEWIRRQFYLINYLEFLNFDLGSTGLSARCHCVLRISGTVAIPLREIEIKAIRSQGSGGQNVNKVSTAVHLFFDIRKSSLPDWVKNRLLNLRDHRITDDGMVVLKSQESRSQEANREAALERLRQLVLSGTVVQKNRRPTKPTRGSKERRLKGKVLRGKIKSQRARPNIND